MKKRDNKYKFSNKYFKERIRIDYRLFDPMTYIYYDDGEKQFIFRTENYRYLHTIFLNLKKHLKNDKPIKTFVRFLNKKKGHIIILPFYD